jgi:ribosome maturation factor RimP
METTPLLETEVEGEIRRIAQERGCELLAVESSGTGRNLVLRLVIDREGGVTLEDCERVSREVSPLLDAEGGIPHAYHLEVSSPGLDRRIYSAGDAERFLGRLVKVRSSIPVEGSRNFRGRLESVDGDRLRIVDEAQGKTYNVRFGDVRVARLEVEWPDPAKNRRKS